MRTILVPLDGSQFAERALPAALALAMQHGAGIHVVAVHRPSLPVVGGQGAMVYDQRYDAEMRQELERYVEQTVTAIRADDATIGVTGRVVTGEAASALVDYARQQAVDLVVITSHGRSGPARWLLGSVADALVRRLEVPVLVIRADDAGSVPAMPYARVLVALDGTPESETAVATAVQLLRTDRTEFTLLHVVPPLHPVLRLLATQDELARDMDEQQAASKAYLRDAAARGASLAPLQSALCVDLHPAHGITEYAADHAMDCIVLSTHGRGPLGRAVLGSIADKVLRTAHVPVLLCHAPYEETSVAPDA